MLFFPSFFTTRGYEVRGGEFYINCNRRPEVEHREIAEHVRAGRWKWDPKVTLYSVPGQTVSDMSGHDLYDRVKDKPVMNAAVLEFLLAHPECIPDSWKTRRVVFWGTTYYVVGDQRAVRVLYWGEKRGWFEEEMWLRDRFDCRYVAGLYCHLHLVSAVINPILELAIA